MNITTRLIKKSLPKTPIKPLYTTNAATQTLQQPHFSSWPHSQNPPLLNPVGHFSHFRPTSIFNHSCPVSCFWCSGRRSFCNSVSVEDSDETSDEDEGWEEEDEVEPELGDGGDGGGIVLQNCSWGARALSIARELLPQYGDDIELFAFKTLPRGYIYLRLDKHSEIYGCPGIEMLESYNREYQKRLDEAGHEGEVPEKLAIEVSSPGAVRLLKVPDDLQRFQDMPMRVSYIEDVDTKCSEKTAVFYLDEIETESGSCIWSLADVKENRDPAAKGRPFNRKQKDWRLKIPYAMVKKVQLYLDH